MDAKVGLGGHLEAHSVSPFVGYATMHEREVCVEECERRSSAASCSAIRRGARHHGQPSAPALDPTQR